jgi:hypothetical protein
MSGTCPLGWAWIAGEPTERDARSALASADVNDLGMGHSSTAARSPQAYTTMYESVQSPVVKFVAWKIVILACAVIQMLVRRALRQSQRIRNSDHELDLRIGGDGLDR